jgi:hypothetical protein
MRSVRIALVGGLTLVAIAVGLTLTRSPTIVIATDGVSREAYVAETSASASGCQGNETAPAGTSAIRLTLAANIGPEVGVRAMAGRALLTHGARGAGWTGAAVTVPVERVLRTTTGVRICFSLEHPIETVKIFGRKTPAAIAIAAGAQKLPGRVGIEYLRAGSRSWLSLVPSIVKRMGSGHSWPGSWLVFVLIAGMALSGALMCRLILRELG